MEQEEQGKGDEFGGQDVPGPGTEEVEERGVLRLGAEIHVVGFIDSVESADEDGDEIEHQHGPDDRAGTRARLPGPDEVEDAGDDEAVVEEELDGAEGGE